MGKLCDTSKETDMKVTGFNHFAIETDDYESSLAFFRDILGFKHIETIDTAEFSSTNLAIPGGCVVELVSRHEKEKQATIKPESNVHHIAFNVDDVEASEATLRKSGVEIVLPCTNLEEFNTKVVQCRDPNGIIMAFRKDLR
jgi:glyoxylase I family protein